MTTVAIMQPYFIPYAGYFSLIKAADIFIIYDCVQFPRRGWVHRNRLTDTQGNLKWLTLPLAKAPQESLIQDLKFTEDASVRFTQQTRSFPSLRDHHVFTKDLLNFNQPFVEYATDWLKRLSGILNIDFKPERSSALHLPIELRNQQRILAICQHYGATKYINAAGGIELYDSQAFDEKGIELAFLKPWPGNSVSMLERVIHENPKDIRDEINRHANDIYCPC